MHLTDCKTLALDLTRPDLKVGGSLKIGLGGSKMRPRGLRKHPERPPGRPKVLLERSGGSRGHFPTAPRPKKKGPRKKEIRNTLFWGSFWLRFGYLRLKNCSRSENSEMLQNDDPYSIFAMFLRPEGSKMSPKCAQNVEQ